MAAKTDLPGWFPFAVAASFLVMIGAGIRSGWRMSSSKPPEPAPPPVRQAGMLQGVPPRRRFFWYVLLRGATKYETHGPEHLTDQEAHRLEFVTRQAQPWTKLYRFVWIPTKGAWIYDARSEPALLASREILDAHGVAVG